jgi:ketosteroid isomerase-like protein
MSSALLDRLFSAIDAMDIEAFVACLTDNGVFRFGSAPPVQGRDAVGRAVGDFFGTIAGLSHEITRTVSDGDALICEGEVTYTRHDGSRITLPFADIFELDDGLIADYRIYADIGPLYAT